MPYSIETRDGIIVDGIPDDLPADHPTLKSLVVNTRFKRDVGQYGKGVPGPNLDLSLLSVDDLKALRSGDLSKVSTAGLNMLRHQSLAARANAQFAADAVGDARTRAQSGQMATESATGLERFFAGAGKAVADTGRGIGQWLGTVSDEDVTRSRERDAALMDSGAGLAGNIGGNLAMVVTPGMALSGTGKALASMPNLARAATGLRAAGTGLLAPRTIAGGAGLGGTYGLLQPAVGLDERISNTGLGMLTGAAVPAASRALSAGRAAVEPFSQSGKARIVGNTLRRAAGPYADDVAQRLESARPIVPGSRPTVGQAARNPGIAAMERTATAIDPTVGGAYGERLAAQNQARIGALERVAGNLDDATKARRSATEGLYTFAKDRVVNADDELRALLSRPSAQRAWKRAQEIATEQGDEIFLKGNAGREVVQTGADGIPQIMRLPAEADEFSVKGLHYLKRGLDDIMDGTKAEGLGNVSRDAMQGTKKALLKWLEKNVPEYEQARATYEAMSRPVNQAQIRDALLQTVDPLTGKLSPRAYSRALNDKTAARATGFDRATLAGTMDPEQLGMLNAIRRDLRRANYAASANRSGSDTVQKLAYSNLIDATGIPTWLRLIPGAEAAGNIGLRGADALYSRANQEIAGLLAETMLDPQRAGLLMREAGKAAKPGAVAKAARRALSAPALAAPGVASSAYQF